MTERHEVTSMIELVESAHKACMYEAQPTASLFEVNTKLKTRLLIAAGQLADALETLRQVESMFPDDPDSSL